MEKCRSRRDLPDRMKIHLLILTALIFLNAGCGPKEAPGEEAKDGLEKAREGIAQAREGVEQTQDSLATMQARSESLRLQIEQQQGKLGELIDQRLELLRRQIDALGQRVRRLPADQETAFQAQLASLSQKRDAVAANLQAYREASPEKSAESLRQLDDALAQFQTDYEKVAADIDGADAATEK